MPVFKIRVKKEQALLVEASSLSVLKQVLDESLNLEAGIISEQPEGVSAHLLVCGGRLPSPSEAQRDDVIEACAQALDSEWGRAAGILRLMSSRHPLHGSGETPLAEAQIRWDCRRRTDRGECLTCGALRGQPCRESAKPKESTKCVESAGSGSKSLSSSSSSWAPIPSATASGMDAGLHPVAADNACADAIKPATCGWFDETYDDATDPHPMPESCSEPATHISCTPFMCTPTCAKHKCRCAKPLPVADTPSADREYCEEYGHDFRRGDWICKRCGADGTDAPGSGKARAADLSAPSLADYQEMQRNFIEADSAARELRVLLADVIDDCSPPENHFRCIVCGSNHTLEDDGDPSCSVSRGLRITRGDVRDEEDMKKCGIEAAGGMIGYAACEDEWGHDGDIHSNAGDGFYARQHDEEHHRRQKEKKP